MTSFKIQAIWLWVDRFGSCYTQPRQTWNFARRRDRKPRIPSAMAVAFNCDHSDEWLSMLLDSLSPSEQQQLSWLIDGGPELGTPLYEVHNALIGYMDRGNPFKS